MPLAALLDGLSAGDGGSALPVGARLFILPEGLVIVDCFIKKLKQLQTWSFDVFKRGRQREKSC